MPRPSKLKSYKYTVAEIYAFLNSQDKFDVEEVKNILIAFTVFLNSRKALMEIQSNFMEGK